MSLVTLADLRTQARNRSDMRINGIFTDADFNSAINSSIFELNDLVVKAYGENYFLSSSIIPLQAGVTLYPMPAMLYKVMGVDWQVNGNTSWQSLKTYEFQDRNQLAQQTQTMAQCSTNTRYCLYGSGINLLPAPGSGQQIQVWYVPTPAPLVNDTDTYDFQNGWQEFVILGAAIKALAAEESDTSVFMAQKAEMRQRIEDMAPTRDVTEPHIISGPVSMGEWW